MSLRKLNALFAVGLSAALVAIVSAGPQAAAPKNVAGQAAPKTATPPASTAKPAAPGASAQELSEHPEILTQDFNPQVVSLFGVKLGDKTAKAKDSMDLISNTMPGMMKMKEGNQLRYNPLTLTVTALVVNNRTWLLKANLQDRYDVEFRFGKPDISDERHAVYLSRRMLVTYNSQDITGIEIR